MRHLLLALLLTSFIASATSEPLMWRVDDRQTGGRAYLFGSVHFGTQALYPLPEAVEKAYSSSDELVVELDMAAVAPNIAAQTMREMGRYIDGDSLHQHLDSDTLNLLADACLELGLPVAALEYLKPWLVAVQLTAFQVRRAGFSDDLGIDRHFIDRVKLGDEEGPSKLVELETFEQQLSIFRAFTDEQQLQFLRQTLTEFKSSHAQLQQILKAWQQGDADELGRIIQQGFMAEGASAKFYELIYERRNQSMGQSIQTMLSAGRQLFVVVGVGHLVGPEGLAAKLAEQGHKVTQLTGIQD